MRRILLFLLPLLLVLTACGGASTGKSAGDADVFESVTVSGGSDKKAPKVEFDTPLKVTAPAVKTLVEGDGKAIKAGQQITFNAAFFNAEDGSKLGDTYEGGQPQPLPVDDTLKEQDAELYEVLVGTKVGAQVGYTRPVEEPAEGQEATPQQLVVLKIISAKDPAPEPKILSPEDVSTLDDEGKLPTFKFAKDGAPEVTIPDNEPSKDLVVKVLKEGDGEVVAESDTITANYSGWRWEDGEQFDSSFERGEPAEFPLTGVIEGWTKGLAGQKVGSQVLLVIPGAWGYGDPAPEGRPSGTLVFFVEITGKSAAK
ncbi:peptidylprolyl isomerase [Arthrobacter crusticola]|uniref:Peptidyl-prolyl cis-trans isomerase n=1 Tax=Arthrobacter crusticola TaxID=2547960 RepID=A0A4R5U353_9MICC|nr:FKBP-type peptidyl-prolyl cis-trans isomerase [Arthrobacter crusticola]TDK28028.1 peptidylprolyl isomerase [Arthrobacter crusticola]